MTDTVRDTVKLYHVDGIARLSGKDSPDPNPLVGCYFQQIHGDESIDGLIYNLADCTDLECPKCGADLRDLDSLDQECSCGAYLLDVLLDPCAACGAPVYNGWLCLDGGDVYCTDCVEIVHYADDTTYAYLRPADTTDEADEADETDTQAPQRVDLTITFHFVNGEIDNLTYDN